ncbi:9959_t:CDS:10, partial [Funneliformis mosseae]
DNKENDRFSSEKINNKLERPTTPENKIRTITSSDERSLTLAVPIEPSTIPFSAVPEQDKDIFNKTMLREYLNIQRYIYNHSTSKDWLIGECNISNDFRKFQISNIKKLEGGATFLFSSDVEMILSLHHIMLIDLTMMKKPNYVTTDEQSWRASIRQRSQPDLPNFFFDIMNEYEKVINDIDELRLVFYKMWGIYCAKIIYSDNERRIFETVQVVVRSFFERMHVLTGSVKDDNEDTIMHEYIHDIFKETFRDSNYEIVWANSQSESSKEHRAFYGRSQGKRSDMTLYRIVEKNEREETCFIEAKPFTTKRKSKVGGYNLYKVGIFCQGGINKLISIHGNKLGTKTFGDTFASYIYFCSMDLEYDGIYRCFKLSEVKIAQKLYEFNLVRKLIMETYFLKCRIDHYYSNRNDRNGSPRRNSFVRSPTISPKAPKNAVPDSRIAIEVNASTTPKNLNHVSSEATGQNSVSETQAIPLGSTQEDFLKMLTGAFADEETTNWGTPYKDEARIEKERQNKRHQM